MQDSPNIIIPQDATRININRKYEVEYWCDKFNCTEEELKKAINRVGVTSEAVKEYLKENSD
jgi:hypothetical protein